MRGKNGFEMAVTTVIMIVLSIAVLTILIVFVNSQTGFLSRWFRTHESESNVDSVVSACNALVATESVYSYCCEKKEIIFGGVPKRNNIMRTCNVSRGESWSDRRIGELSCDEISC
jgi:hypothetical protein